MFRRPRCDILAPATILLAVLLTSPLAASQDAGGGDANALTPEDLQVPEGFQVDAVISGLDFPTSIAWDDNGTTYVALSGFVYGINQSRPGEVLRVDEDGTAETIAEGFDPPLTDITWHEGSLYVAERGAITRLTEDNGTWARETLVDGLPAFGDHHTNEITFGPDGRLYFGQGTTTNSGVVGLDNLRTGWTVNITEGSDVPCEDITLRGLNYVTDNPWLGERVVRHFERAPIVVYESEGEIPPEARGVQGSNVTTGTYVPFGTPTYAGATLPGQVPCNGAIHAMNPDGTGLDVHAWGFRNPFGLQFDADGQLWTSENMYDTRGSRPVAECPDFFRLVEEGQWYGYPDFCGSEPLDQARYALPEGEPPQILLERSLEASPPSPNVELDDHTGVTKFDFAPGEPWGSPATVYLAQFGDMVPVTGLPGEHYGMAVVKFDSAGGGEAEVFLAAEERFGGDFRPLEAIFGPDGNLYVVHIGAVPVVEAPPDAPVPVAPAPRAGTGAVYMVSAAEAAPPEEQPPQEEPPQEAETEDETPGPGAWAAVGGLAAAATFSTRRRRV